MLAELLYPLQDGHTPLHLAARRGHTICVKRLLSTPGIDVNIKDGVSWSIECIIQMRGYLLLRDVANTQQKEIFYFKVCGQSFRKCVNLNEGHSIVWYPSHPG